MGLFVKSYTPSPHPCQVYREPEGPGIRVDTGVTEGSEISVFYDPMVAKLITTGHNRDAALNTMGSALDRWEGTACV
jgi:acetyl/propionyl-CoA carboxylase alpha subunit